MRTPGYKLVTLAAILSLVGLGLAQAENDESVRKKAVPGHRFRRIEFVYRWDIRSPRQVRAEGGFFPPYYDYDDSSRAFYLNHHMLGEFHPDGHRREWNWRTAYVTTTTDWRTVSYAGGWLYQIHATPNMLMPILGSGSFPNAFALGGIHWSQITHYTYMQTASPTGMIPNGDYQGRHYTRYHATPLNLTITPMLSDQNLWDCQFAWAWAYNFMSRPAIANAIDWQGCFPLPTEAYPYDDSIPGPTSVPMQISSVRHSNQASQEPECQPGPSGLQCRARKMAAESGDSEPGHCDAQGGCPSGATRESKTCIPTSSEKSRQQCKRRVSRGKGATASTSRAHCAANPSDTCGNPEQVKKDENWLDGYLKSYMDILSTSQRSMNPIQEEQPTPTPTPTTTESSTEEMDHDQQESSEGPSSSKKKKPDQSSKSEETAAPTAGDYQPTSQEEEQRRLVATDEELEQREWRVTIAALVAACHLSASRPSSPRKRSQPEDFVSLAKCNDAIDKIVMIDSCKQIRNLEIGFRLSNDYWSGTWSEISAVVGGPRISTRVPIASEPYLDFNTWVPVNFSLRHGLGFYEREDIRSISLATRPIKGRSIGNQWKLQDVELRARCAYSNNLIRMTKYKGTNQWYGKSSSRDLEAWQLDHTFEVVPSDWTMHPPCTYFQRLVVEFKLSNDYFAGTSDSIAISIGPMRHPQLLARDPGRNFTTAVELDLGDLYASEAVEVNSLSSITLLDLSGKGWFAGGAWKFQGLRLSGMCVGSERWIHINKFQKVQEWLAPKSPQTGVEAVWKRSISEEMWEY